MNAPNTYTERTPLSPRSLNTQRTPPSAGFWMNFKPLFAKSNIFGDTAQPQQQVQTPMPPSPPTTPPSLQASAVTLATSAAFAPIETRVQTSTRTRSRFLQRPVQPNPLIPTVSTLDRRGDIDSGNESSSSSRDLRRRERASRFLRGVRERREGSRWDVRSEQIMRHDDSTEQAAREAALAAAAPATEWFEWDDSADDLMAGADMRSSSCSQVWQPVHAAANNNQDILTMEEEAAAIMEREQQELNALVEMMDADADADVDTEATRENESDIFDASDDDAIYDEIWAAETRIPPQPLAPARVDTSWNSAVPAFTHASTANDAAASTAVPDEMDVSE